MDDKETAIITALAERIRGLVAELKRTTREARRVRQALTGIVDDREDGDQ